MLGGISGSVVGKVLAGVLGVVGLAGGLAAAGSFPGVGNTAPEVEVTVDTPASSAQVSTSARTLDLGSLPAGSAAAETMAMIEQARSSAAQATAAAQQCLNSADSQLGSLMTTLKGVTDVTQIQGLLGRAKAIGSDAQKCADQAKALSKTSVDQAAAAAAKAAGLGGLPGLGGLGDIGNPQYLLAQILAAAEEVGAAAAAAETATLGVVNQVVTTVGSLLPIPGGEGGGLPLPIPGTGEGGLPIIGDLPGLPLPGAGEGGLPLPGTGEGGLPLPALDGLGDATGLVTDLAHSVLGGLGSGGLPIPAL